MATMNATGGPVGGGMMMINNNNGSPAMPGGMNAAEASRQNLNTYIYDYLLKHGHYDIARSIIADGSFEFNKAPAKTSPGRRKDGGEMNGDADGMDMDQKDDVPDDLPRPRGWEGSQGNCFLLEWFNIFFDIFQAHTSKKGSNPAAAAYLNNEKQAQRQREMTQNQNLMRQGMNPALMRNMNGMPNGSMPKLNPQQMQQMQQIQAKRAQMAQQQQQLNRGEQPDAEMNGVRPGTPGDGDAGGSPSKRARIDNGQQNFNNGMIQNGRPAAGPGAQNQMLMQSGFQPPINQPFRQNGGMPPKAMQGAMPNGAMMNMGNAGSPMMQGMNQYPEGMQMEFMQQRNMQGGQPGMAAGGGGQSGNHALQDYQMQLMLLEQQNKKRLMMARQEQHENNPGAGGPMPGVNMQATGMSPGGSRTGASPNPEAMAGRSPGPMNFMNNMQGGEFHPQQMFMGDKGQMQMGPGPQPMRPPTSNAMGQPGGRPGPFQGGQPMQQQGSQAGQQIGTPGQREMPPPQAPAGGSAQRNQGASPSGGNAPPTPSQTNKANPKGTKKAAANKDDAKRQRPAKKGAAANAGANDENPPATPTPSTPITPNNPGVMNAANKGQQGMQGQNQHPQNPGMQMSQPMQQNDMQFGYGDTGNGGENQPFNLDFTSLENADVLENFDFDSFLNTSADDAFNVDIGGDFSADFMGQTE